MPTSYPSYYDIFRDQQAAAQRAQQMRMHMQEQRANELLRQQQLDDLIRHRGVEELYQQRQQDFQQQRYLQRDTDRAQSDEQTNRLVNQTNPPAAVAVTPPGGDPAWTDRANAMRDRFLRGHPEVRPGPPQPYTGGAAMLPHVRTMVAPTLPASRGPAAARPVDPAKARAALQADIDGIRGNLSQVVPLDQVENATGLYPVGKGGEFAPGSPDMWVNGPTPGRVTPNFGNAKGVKAPRSMDSVMEMYRQLSAKKKALAEMGEPEPSAPVPASPEPSPPGSVAPAPTTYPTGTRARKGTQWFTMSEDGTWQPE